jgi:hypothetical protein
MPKISIERLRKIHPLWESCVQDKKTEMKGGSYKPVSVHTYTGLPGVEIIAVVDGMHRTQAACELRWDAIDCREVDEQAARAEARQRGLNFDDLIHRAKRFVPYDYS